MSESLTDVLEQTRREFIADTDARFACLLREIAATGDPETDHKRADNTLETLLTVLNCHKTVAAYREVKKWYS